MASFYRFYTGMTGAVALVISLLVLGIGALLLYGFAVWQWSDPSLYAGIAMCLSSLGFVIRYMFVLFADSI